MFSTSVITSKAAQNDLNKIKSVHADLLTRMANQAQKVAQFNQQKSADLAAQNNMNLQIEKERALANTEAQKTAADISQKNAEIDIKRAQMSAM